jgi:ribosomal protein S18 acetylase RimI-like enzyme
MNPAVNVRQFRYPEDFMPVIDLWDNAGPGVHLGRSDTEGEILKKLGRDPDLFLVAELDNEIVGAVLGGFDGRRGLVYHLAVRREFRHHGLGAALMDTLENRLREKGCLRSYLLVTKDNDVSSFYQSRGWQRLDLVVFAKDL